MSGYTLIVDDDEATCQMLGSALRAIGVQSRAAHDGVEALEVIHDELPELIMLDLMMPRMNGIELFKQLQVDPITIGIPIIVLTANPDERLRDELPGVEHYLLKGTYRIPELRELVAVAIGQR